MCFLVQIIQVLVLKFSTRLFLSILQEWVPLFKLQHFLFSKLISLNLAILFVFISIPICFLAFIFLLLLTFLDSLSFYFRFHELYWFLHQHFTFSVLWILWNDLLFSLFHFVHQVFSIKILVAINSKNVQFPPC